MAEPAEKTDLKMRFVHLQSKHSAISVVPDGVSE